MAANIQAGIQIKASVDGLQTVNKLATDINKLADELKDAGIDASALASETQALSLAFNQVAQNQALIANYKELKRESKSVATNIQALKQRLQEYDTQIQAGDGSKKLQAEYKKAERELKNLVERKKDLAQALRTTRTGMDEAGISTKNLSNHEKQLADEAEGVKAKLVALTDEAKKLKAVADAKLQFGLDIDDRIKEKINEITTAYNTLKDSGTLSAQELAKAHQIYEQQIKALGDRTEEGKAKLAELAEEAQRLKAIADARIEFGLDIDDRIKEEIKKITTEYNLLKDSGTLSAQELAKAHELHEQKIKSLSEKTTEGKAKLAELAEEAKKVNKLAEAKTVLGLDVDAKVKVKINEIKKAYEDLKKSGTLSSKELARANEAHKTKVKELRTELGKMPSKMTPIASSLQGIGKAGLAAAGIGGGLYLLDSTTKCNIVYPEEYLIWGLVA